MRVEALVLSLLWRLLWIYPHLEERKKKIIRLYTRAICDSNIQHQIWIPTSLHQWTTNKALRTRRLYFYYVIRTTLARNIITSCISTFYWNGPYLFRIRVAVRNALLLTIMSTFCKLFPIGRGYFLGLPACPGIRRGWPARWCITPHVWVPGVCVCVCVCSGRPESRVQSRRAGSISRGLFSVKKPEPRRTTETHSQFLLKAVAHSSSFLCDSHDNYISLSLYECV